MELRKWAINKLLGGDRNMLSKIILDNVTFVKKLDLEAYNRDCEELWSAAGYTHRGLRKWIEDRKALILLQNMIEGSDKNGLRAVLNEWEMVESWIHAEAPRYDGEVQTDTSPELKTKEQILEAFNGSHAS